MIFFDEIDAMMSARKVRHVESDAFSIGRILLLFCEEFFFTEVIVFGQYIYLVTFIWSTRSNQVRSSDAYADNGTSMDTDSDTSSA